MCAFSVTLGAGCDGVGEALKETTFLIEVDAVTAEPALLELPEPDFYPGGALLSVGGRLAYLRPGAMALLFDPASGTWTEGRTPGPGYLADAQGWAAVGSMGCIESLRGFCCYDADGDRFLVDLEAEPPEQFRDSLAVFGNRIVRGASELESYDASGPSGTLAPQSCRSLLGVVEGQLYGACSGGLFRYQEADDAWLPVTGNSTIDGSSPKAFELDGDLCRLAEGVVACVDVVTGTVRTLAPAPELAFSPTIVDGTLFVLNVVDSYSTAILRYDAESDSWNQHFIVEGTVGPVEALDGKLYFIAVLR